MSLVVAPERNHGSAHKLGQTIAYATPNFAIRDLQLMRPWREMTGSETLYNNHNQCFQVELGRKSDPSKSNIRWPHRSTSNVTYATPSFWWTL